MGSYATINIDNYAIKRSFSCAVDTYDCSSDLQDYIVDLLFKKISCLDISFGPILEFGCGTGLLTKRLLEFFPDIYIFSFDLSFNMCKRAKVKIKPKANIDFLVADVQYPSFRPSSFSAIFSSSSFQWVNSPKETLSNLKNLLLKDGVLIISTFGPKTLRELSHSLSLYFNKKVSIVASKFLDKEELACCLTSCFKEFYIEEVMIIKRYISLFELLKILKNTGANIKTPQLSSFVFTKKSIQLIDEIYKKEFGEIRASYQVFLCEAKR